MTEAAASGPVKDAASSGGDAEGCDLELVSGASGGLVRRLLGIFLGAGEGETVGLRDATGTDIEAGSEAHAGLAIVPSLIS